jgi:hypothetical protein
MADLQIPQAIYNNEQHCPTEFFGLGSMTPTHPIIINLIRYPNKNEVMRDKASIISPNEKYNFESYKIQKIQNTKYKIQKIQNTKYKIQNTKYKIQNTKYKIQNTKYKIQNTKYKNNNNITYNKIR